MKIIVNPDAAKAAEIRLALRSNEGYCPCRIIKSEDSKCLCKEFREQEHPGLCHCGLYMKVEG